MLWKRETRNHNRTRLQLQIQAMRQEPILTKS